MPSRTCTKAPPEVDDCLCHGSGAATAQASSAQLISQCSFSYCWRPTQDAGYSTYMVGKFLNSFKEPLARKGCPQVGCGAEGGVRGGGRVEGRRQGREAEGGAPGTKSAGTGLRWLANRSWRPGSHRYMSRACCQGLAASVPDDSGCAKGPDGVSWSALPECTALSAEAPLCILQGCAQGCAQPVLMTDRR